MPNLKVYQNGLTVFQESTHPRVPPLRGNCSGWSQSSTRRLIRWLYSVDIPALCHDGQRLWSFTFSVRVCPSSPDQWKRLRENLFRRCHRLGIFRIFWLTEWQRRGVPHLHGIMVLPCDANIAEVAVAWLQITADLDSTLSGQYVRELYSNGWFEYLAKHSARGVNNYQRDSRNIPAQWQGVTGRMWGHRGNWPRHDPLEFLTDHAAFFRIRRILRSRAVSQARARADWKALRYARSMLKSPDQIVSRVRGLSVFSDLDDSISVLDAVVQAGHSIEQ